MLLGNGLFLSLEISGFNMFYKCVLCRKDLCLNLFKTVENC